MMGSCFSLSAAATGRELDMPFLTGVFAKPVSCHMCICNISARRIHSFQAKQQKLTYKTNPNDRLVVEMRDDNYDNLSKLHF